MHHYKVIDGTVYMSQNLIDHERSVSKHDRGILVNRIMELENQLTDSLKCCKLTKYPPYHIIDVDMNKLEDILLKYKEDDEDDS